MNQILPVFKKEFFGYFRSPVGYVILAVFHVIIIGIAIRVQFYESNVAELGRPLFNNLPWVLVVFIPAIGMRLWSEEKRSGSIELLFTLPLSPLAAVVGKYLAALCFVGIALLLTTSLAATIGYLGSPDWGTIISGYIGAFLLAATYLSISSVCSAMTKNQVIAFVIGSTLCFFATLLGSEALTHSLESFVSVEILQFLNLMSFEQHFSTMVKGLIDISAISFFGLLTLAGLAINVIVLER